MDGTLPPHADHLPTAPVKRHVTQLRIGDWIDLDGRAHQIKDIRARPDGGRVLHFLDAPPLTRATHEPVHVHTANHPQGPAQDRPPQPAGPHPYGDPAPPSLDTSAQQELLHEARRRGITRLQVVALVQRDHDHLLLIRPPGDEAWTLPTAWIHPSETINDALDWLCNPRLGLTGWKAILRTTVIRPEKGGAPALQIVFAVTSQATINPTSATHFQWWNIRYPPPPLHRQARTLITKLYPN